MIRVSPRLPVKPSCLAGLIAAWLIAVRVLVAGPCDADFESAMSLAKAERWSEAEETLEAGRRACPLDKRFPLELAGIAFKQRNTARAKSNLRYSLRLDPGDAYALDFLATVYLLEDNLDAALRYWNRIGKPRIEQIRIDPEPSLDPEVLDRSFAFAPSSVLSLAEVRETRARIDLLASFSTYKLDLHPRSDLTFDAVFRANQRSGWEAGGWHALISTLRGVAHETVYPEAFGLGRRAMNLRSMMRWDDQKRRAHLALSAPFGPKMNWRWQVCLDGRQEIWDLSETFRPSVAPRVGAKKLTTGIDFSRAAGLWTFGSGAEVVSRNLRDAPQSGRAALFSRSPSVSYMARAGRLLLDIPERRLSVRSELTGEVGRLLSGSFRPFGKAEASLSAHWYPLARGRDYATRTQLRAGTAGGPLPFDKLFALGIERDNDLWMRAHPGARGGRKGSAPMGTEYLLFNWEADKVLARMPLLDFSLGPFLDSGAIGDSAREFGSRKWLWDTGVQTKVRALGLQLVLSWGKDLRSGRDAFYFTVAR